MKINLKTHSIEVCDCFPDSGDDQLLITGFKRKEENRKFGLINPEGKLILPCEYDYIRIDSDKPWSSHFVSPFININKDNHWGLADTTGKIFIPPLYTNYIRLVADSLFIVEKQESDGYVQILLDDTGKKVLSENYDEIKWTKTTNSPDSVFFFKLKKNKKYGLYNPQTKKWIAPEFDDLETGFPDDLKINKSLVQIEKGQKIGFFNVKTGQFFIPPKFDFLQADEEASEGIITVRNNGKYGLYDDGKQKMIVPADFDYIDFLTDSLLSFGKGGVLSGIMDLNGKILAPAKYNDFYKLSKDFYALLRQKENGSYDIDFFRLPTRQFIEPKSGTVTAVGSDSIAAIKTDSGYQLYNPAIGKFIDGDYKKGGLPDRIYFSDNGLAIVQKDAKAGLVDGNGNKITPVKYAEIGNFHHGVARFLSVEYADSGVPFYGYLDSTGKEILAPKYMDYGETASFFIKNDLLLISSKKIKKKEGDALVIYDKPVYGLASQTGKIILQPEYDKVIAQKNGDNFVVEKDEKFGILDGRGKTILPLQFDDIILSDGTWPGEAEWEFSFPILAKKDSVFQYFQQNGIPLPVKVKKRIPFDNI